MGWSRWIATKPAVQRTVGLVAAEYLRFVWHTNTVTLDPPNLYELVDPQLPVIVAMWHGQHFMMPFIKRQNHHIKVLISRHRDGEMNAVAAERLGIETIRGSGSHSQEFHRKGGVKGFRAMLDSIEDGYNIAMTADVPKVARIAGLGVVKLAARSGRPIIPVAFVTSRRLVLDNWDRSTINLPFGRAAIVIGDIITVAPDADEGAQETARRAVESQLDIVHARAYALVDRKRAVPNSGKDAQGASHG